MTTRDDLVSRLRHQITSDHKRVCQGRTYSCDCGYDLGTEQMLERAASALEAKDAEIARQSEEATTYHKFWIEERDKRIAAESRISDLERQLAAETERCARVAEDYFAEPDFMIGNPMSAVGDAIAAAIRGGAK